MKNILWIIVYAVLIVLWTISAVMCFVSEYTNFWLIVMFVIVLVMQLSIGIDKTKTLNKDEPNSNL